MASESDCDTCGETLTLGTCPAGPHDCTGCEVGTADGQCDRGHLTCSDCRWTTGEGPDAGSRCTGCESDADDHEAAIDDMRGEL
jgi:hypothetical protein